MADIFDFGDAIGGSGMLDDLRAIKILKLQQELEEDRVYSEAVNLSRVPSTIKNEEGFNLNIGNKVNPDLIAPSLMQLGRPRLAQEYKTSALANEQAEIKNAADRLKFILEKHEEVAKTKARSKAVVDGKYSPKAYIGALQAQGRDDLAQAYREIVLANEAMQQTLDLGELDILDKEFDLNLKKRLEPQAQELRERASFVQGYQWFKATGGTDFGGFAALVNPLVSEEGEKIVDAQPVINNGQWNGSIITLQNGRVFAVNDQQMAAFAADANTRYNMMIKAAQDAEIETLTPGRAQMVIHKYYDPFIAGNTTREQDLLMWRAASVLAKTVKDPDTGLLRPGYVDPKIRDVLAQKGLPLEGGFTPFKPKGEPSGADLQEETSDEDTALGQPPRDPSLYELSESAVGVESGVISFASKIPFGIGNIIAETDKAKRISKARSMTEAFTFEISQLFRNNVRSETERQEARKEIARINSNWFNSPENYRNELKNLNRFLTRHLESALKKANNKSISGAEREKARSFYLQLAGFQKELFPPSFLAPVELSESMDEAEFIKIWETIPIGHYFVVDGEGYIKAEE